MTSIEKLLGDLLLRHNCVIIPSFGGFVAQPMGSRVDYVTGNIMPPTKALMFNKQLLNNDGLLINELAQSNGLSFVEASLEVKNRVVDWNKALSSGGRIEIERIGFIYADKENNLCFEQDRFYNLLLSSYGLGRVQFVPEQIVKTEETKVTANSADAEIKIAGKTVPIVTVQDRPAKETVMVEHPALQKKNAKAWKYIAAACILPIAFYSIWIPMKTDVLESGVLAFSDFNPFKTEQEASYKRVKLQEDLSFSTDVKSSLSERVKEIPEDVDVYTYKYDDKLFIPVQISVPDADSNIDDLTVDKETISANAMHFIVGCFGEKSNAENLVLKLKAEGMNAKIVDVKNGLHRVSAGAAISLEAYDQIKNEAQGHGYRGWMLK